MQGISMQPVNTAVRTLAACAAWALACAGLATTAQAQGAFPNKPLTLIIPGAAGSSTDNIGRIIADRLGQALGQTVVIDIRAGGNGAVGARALAAGKPDGYTLMMPGNSISVLASYTIKNPAYDPEKDFVTVAQVVAIPFGITVGTDHPARSLKDLIALARDKEVFFATPGSASISRLIGEWLNQKTGTRLVNIAYPSSAAAHTDVIGGRVAMMVDGLGGVAPHVKSGRMRLLAVTTQNRVKGFDDTPTAAEVVPGFVVPGFFTLVVPPGTPAEIIDTLNRAARQAMQDPRVNERLAIFGAEAASGSVADAERLLREQRTLFKGLVEQAKIKPE